MKTFTVELKATTFREVVCEAKDLDDAAVRAHEEILLDPEISQAWSENAEVIYVKEIES